MRHLVTGGSGFLGRHVLSYLRSGGHQVEVLGRSSMANVVSDLSSGIPSLPSAEYDLVVHAAGKAHVVPRTEAEREEFYQVNVRGTENLLAALEKQDALPHSFVLISTVAVYGLEDGQAIGEDAPRKAEDPYGDSKRHAEDLVLEWGERQGVRVGIVRLPLVVGASAPGNLGKMISAIRKGRYLGIGGGTARRSIVLAEDVARILPIVAEKGGIFNLTDGHHPTFKEIEQVISRVLAKRPPAHLPYSLARLGAVIGDILGKSGIILPLNSRALSKMTSTLTFDDTRARRMLGWNPRSVLESAELWVRP